MKFNFSVMRIFPLREWYPNCVKINYPVFVKKTILFQNSFRSYFYSGGSYFYFSAINPLIIGKKYVIWTMFKQLNWLLQLSSDLSSKESSICKIFAFLQNLSHISFLFLLIAGKINLITFEEPIFCDRKIISYPPRKIRTFFVGFTNI